MMPGETANLDTNARLTIPVGILKVIGWWDEKTIDVLAELVEDGLVRIYNPAEANPRLSALRDAVADLSLEERFEALAVISDRYRNLRLYGDGRLGLTKDVAQVLGFRLKIEKPSLYVQAFPGGFEVLSLNYRLQRLARNKHHSIGLHISSSNNSD